MLIGEEQYPIQESILFLLLLIVLILDVFLFNRGHGSYSVKYQLMRKHRFFRVNQFMTSLVDFFYKLFFSLPFIIIAVITILRAVKNVVSFPPILVNGLIVVLIIYPIHRQFYYFQYGVIWILAVASQIFTQFLTDYTDIDQSSFIQISFIFYTINTIIFCLALLYNQRVYWQMQDALKLSDPKSVSLVNQSWVDDKKERTLPKIFYGGIYGHMYRNYSFTVFIGIYLFSLSILGVYAGVIYASSGSYLGVTGLVTSIIYDIFILIFSTLRENQRSIKSIFYMVYVGRLLSFVFGEYYWLFGYCVMYFLVGIFIGLLIIDKWFPLKIQMYHTKQFKRQKVNALKTPQFVLIVLTVEIVVLIIVQQFTSISDVVGIKYNGREIPVWQFAILIVIATWVVILYLLSGRLLSRHIQKIHSMVEYYFGFANFTQYHLYMILTYSLILAAGLYSLFYLDQKDIFLACLFLPFLYLLIFQIGVAWVKNDYAILADTEEFNKRQIKKLQIREAKSKMMLNRLKEQRQHKNIKKKHKPKQPQNNNNLQTQNQQDLQSQKSQNKLLRVNSQKKGIKYLEPINRIKIKQNQETQNNRNQQYYLTPRNKKKQDFHTPNQQNQSEEKSQSQSSQINFYLQDQLRSSGDNMSQSDDHRHKVSVENYKMLLNWRKNDQLTYTQIWENLTKHDKTIIVFSLILLLTFVGYTLVSYLWAKSIGGLAFSLSIISLITTFVFYKLNIPGETYNAGEIIVGVAGFVMGVVFWGINFEITFGGIVWAVTSCILYVLSLKTGLGKNMQKWLVILLASKIILSLLFICMILWLNYGAGIGVVSICLVVCCILGTANIYYLNRESHLPKFVKYMTGLIIVVIIVALAVIGFQLDILSDFTVFTLLMGIIIVAILIIYLLIYFNKIANQYIHPHVYSAYGLTIYKFQSQNEKLKPSTNHVLVFNIAMVLLVIYSAITTLFFRQKYMAIYSLSIFIVCQFTELIFRSIETHYYMGKNKQYINQKIIRETFKTVMEKYMPDQTEGQDSPFYIQKFINKKRQAIEAKNDEDKNKLWKQTVLLKQQVLKNLEEEQKFLFFWLALIKFTLYSDKLTQMTDFLITMEEIKPELQSFGIVIQGLQSTDSTEIKYKLVQKQIKSLIPSDIIIVEDIIKKRIQSKRKRLKEQEKFHKMNEQAHKEKLQKLFEKQSTQITQIPNLKQTVKMSKSKIQEFKQKIASLSESQLYEDKEFKNDLHSVGSQLSSVVATWRRPKTGQKFITGDGMSPGDVKQGKIGDCYLISSFAVLGQKFLQQALGNMTNSDLSDEQRILKSWKNQKGAYMVRFHKFSREVYIVVDDYLPVDQKNKWVFATSQDPLQFWPGILQKAYAKLYGGYGNIISGKSHQVLAQFTGGFPFQVLVKDYKSNMNALWNKMEQAKKNGYLLAAGSPSNERGDAVASERGIVQGHAYSILDVRLVQSDKKLIKLKNPHGSGGKQWTGAYSDQSRYMTQKMRQELNHQKRDDGIFWMQLSDFINEFKSLYICCIFQKDWKKHPTITGEWKRNINSFGRPQKSNESHKNYQIGITVNKKCTCFISLTQKQKSALNGENFIYLRVQRNEGKRIRKSDVNSDALCGQATKPSDLATISQQIELEASQYPYTFSVYVSAEVQQDKVVVPGQGQFLLQVFCNDMDSKIVKQQEFDTIGKQANED